MLPQLEHLSRNHRVVAVDLRGHGESDKLHSAYSNDEFNWQSYELLAVNNSPATEPGHQLLNWRVDWNNVLDQPIDIGFFMTNATNALFPIGGFGSYATQGFTSYAYNEPRMWGFQLKYRFGEEDAPAPAAAYVPPPAVAPAPVAKSYLVFFDFNKSDLTPDAVSIVDTAAKNAGPAKVTQLTVTGHTDTHRLPHLQHAPVPSSCGIGRGAT